MELDDFPFTRVRKDKSDEKKRFLYDLIMKCSIRPRGVQRIFSFLDDDDDVGEEMEATCTALGRYYRSIGEKIQ